MARDDLRRAAFIYCEEPPLNQPTPGELFERHHITLFRYAYRMTRQRDVAEDIVQETFARVVRRIEQYEPRGRDLQWLFTIVRRLLLDRQRTLERRPAEPSDHTERAGEAQQELSIALREALDTLQELDREAFLLREVGGLTYQEIAIVTDSTVDSVRSRIYRARLQLRTTLSSGI